MCFVFGKLKGPALVLLGMLLAWGWARLRTPGPSASQPTASPPVLAAAPEPPRPVSTEEPLPVSVPPPLNAMDANPRPVRQALNPPSADAAPVNLSEADKPYHEALLAGLDAPDTFAQESALCGKLAEWIRKSPDAVESVVEQISQRYGPNTALRVTAQLWAEEDPAGAKEWALRSGNGGQRMKVIASVAYQLAQRDPQAAMESFKAELDRTPFYEAAAIPLVAQWAATDRAAALAWVNAQTEGDVRNQLLRHIQQASAPSPGPAAAQQP